MSYEAQRGLYLHPIYVVTPQREPLGVTNAWMWARQFKDGDAPRGGLLESRRWIDPPPGAKPVVWRLLTNRTASTMQQAC